jgi:hypothetical protein
VLGMLPQDHLLTILRLSSFPQLRNAIHRRDLILRRHPLSVPFWLREEWPCKNSGIGRRILVQDVSIDRLVGLAVDSAA